jgi:PAS domain S-box-containing protein
MAEANNDLSTTHPDDDRLKLEERFRIISELTSDFAYADRVDPDGTIVPEWVSETVIRVTGYLAQEINLRGLQSIIYPEDWPAVRQHLKRVLAGQSDVCEIRIVAKNGEVRWLRDYARPIWDEAQARTVRIYGAAQDITEIKMAQEAMAALASIVESSDDAILSKSLQGIILSWNKGAERLYGYTAEEVIGQSVSILIPPEEADDFPEIMRRIRRGEKVDPYETERVRKDGQRLSVSLTVSPILDPSGKVMGASAIARDISHRRRAEEALQASERRFFKSFHSSPIPMSISTLSEGRFVDVNDTLLQTNGYLREEFVGRTSQELDVWVDPEDRAEMIRRLKESGTVRNLETRFRLKDGGTRTFLVSVELIELDGQPCILMACNDITERKRAEVEREQLLEREQALRREAEDARQQSAELFLRERAARQQAEEASRTKDEFLATLSHELRTPLNAIVGWATIINSSTLDETTTKQAMAVIERNAKTQAQLIEDLLDVSRIITGKMRLDVQPVDLPLVIQAAVDAIGPAASAKGIALQLLLDPNAGPVSGDPGRLQQVLWNLLSNAVKFTPKGGRVQVRLERVDSQVQLTISDTGEGIKAEFLPYIFDRFRQADSSITRVHGGLGLGMSIVRHLVELHGGKVEAESAGEGSGATFTITLPITIRQSKGRNGIGALEQPETISKSDITDFALRLDRLRMIVIEDEPDARDLLVTILNQYGAEVRVAASAAEGMELLEQQKPDVLISDIEMPYEDGYSFIRKVRTRSLEQGGQVPAIALTAHARTEDRLRALSAGFDAHVTKPIDLVELVTVIVSITRRADRVK